MGEKLSEEEKERRRQEKEARKKQWEAENKNKVQSKKVLTKAERRELQEKQKAAKQQKPVPTQRAKKESKDWGSEERKTTDLFSHLAPPRTESNSKALNVGFDEEEKIHPAVVSLGLKMAEGKISGANARAAAMLTVMKEVIRDYTPPENMSIARDLDKYMKQMIQFLIKCRPHSITMGNAIKHVRKAITSLPPDISDAEAKLELYSVIDTYLHTNLTVAQEEIVKLSVDKISNGDVILTFGRSFVVEQALLAAFARGLQFKVVVASTGPGHEGKLLVKRLAEAGLDCVFVLLTSISYMMANVTKVIMGANAMLSNGTCLGSAGTALVAMMANTFNKPVLICAETHKFSERVQLDAICHNELGDPQALVLPASWDGDETTKSILESWKSRESLDLLNLKYDLTPANFITMVITEFGPVPASSVPVIVREKEQRVGG